MTTRSVKAAEAAVVRIELGCAGHFICARDCHWRRHTQVGNYRVSSVGDLYYKSEPNKRQTVGSPADSFFETLVFKTTEALCDSNDGCGCRQVEDKVDGERYATAGAAQAGHERYVSKYARLAALRAKKDRAP
jgi:hypothetical protein